nr:leucine-rich repeat protein [Butyrivibrio sp.]
GKFVFWNNKNVQLYGPVDNAILEAFAADECVDFNLYRLTFISEGNKEFTSLVKAGDSIADELQDLVKDIERNSYKLMDWTYEDGEETRVWDFDKDMMPQHDLTLTAGWNCVYRYEIREDGTGITITGTGADSADYVIPETLDGYKVVGIAEGSFAKEGLESVTIPAGVTDIQEGAIDEGATIIADSDTAAAEYAASHDIEFKRMRYALTFVSNGGTACTTRYYAKGDKVATLPTPVKDNSEFRGWYKDSNFKNAFDIEKEVFPGEALTLYAYWIKVDSSIENDVFAYDIEDGSITITGYSGRSEYLSIPKTINGVTVTAIGEYAFSGNEYLSFVSLPETVTTIGKRAFYACPSLERVDLTASISSIGEYAFASCNALNSIDLSVLSVTELPRGMFAASAYLYDVKLPATLKVIGDDCFAGCSFLQKIELPKGLTDIGSYAFFNDRVLRELCIPGTVVNIGDSFVDGCSSLKSIDSVSFGAFYSKNGILYKDGSIFRCPEAHEGDVIIEDSVTGISKEAFRNCSLVTGVTLGEKLTTIGSSAFAGCSSLKSLAFGNAPVSRISDSAFYGCVSLTDIVLPASVKSIGRSAFAGCRSLETLTVGADVTSVGKNAFAETGELTVYGYADTEIERYAQSEKNFKFEYIADKAPTPGAPEVLAVENTTITLKPGDDFEYRLNDGEWQKSNVFSALLPLTSYIFYQRVAESPYHHVSDPSEGTAAMTGKALGAAVKRPAIIKITSSLVEIIPAQGCEYSIDGENYQNRPRFDNLQENTSYTVYQRIAESDTVSCGPASSVTFTTKAHTGNCTVIFDLDGGELEGQEDSFTVILAEGEKLTDPGTPVKGKYTFGGWEYNNEVFDFDTEVTNDMTLTAIWIAPPKVETPISNIETMSVVDKGAAVVLSSVTPDADIYYTLDGSEPGCESRKYDAPISIVKDVIIKAIAVKDGYEDSEILTVVLTVKPAEDPSGDDEVPAEDIPEGGIPEGIWVAGLRNFDYTGAAVTQDIRVYYGKKSLTVKTDYTVSYVNNKNAGTAKVVITGKGNYSGKHEFEFAINALDISADEFAAEDIYVAYNGKAQKPSIALLRGGAKLAAGKDYAVSWKNENGKDNEGFTKAGDYEILIEGKGNYTGTRTVIFHVKEATLITKVTLKAIKNAAYTGEEIRPEIELTDKSRKYTLSKGTDYTVTWPDDCTSVGTVTVTITGTGDYAGVRTVSYKITGTPLSKAKINNFVSAFDYADGEEIEQKGVELIYNKAPLTENEDYTLHYENNVNAGTATAIFEGMGGYTGTVKKTFKINGVAMKSVAVAGLDSSYVYTGSEIEPAGGEEDAAFGTVSLTYTDKKTKVKSDLVKGKDYTVSYKNTSKKGTASVTFTGTGRYTGTLTKKFTIKAYDLVGDPEGYVELGFDSEVPYAKNGAKPAVAVSFRGTALTEGTDYTVTYANNNAVTTEKTKKLPSITVKGKGNFAGTLKAGEFTIVPQDISAVSMSAADKVYANKAKAFISTPVLVDVNGAKLAAGKDYNKTVVYKYGEDRVVATGKNKELVERHAGEEIDNADILPVGAVVKAEITGTGNYTGSTFCYYKMIKANISKATVKIRNQYFTGSAVTLDKDDFISVTIGKEILNPDEFEIVSYKSNTNTGTATVVIEGRGIYGGSKSCTFKILKRAIN